MSEMQKYLDTNPRLTRAVVGFLCRGDEVLLGLRKRVSDGLGELLFAGIGGKVEPGETDEQALVRECQEEIGVEVTRWRKIGEDIYLFPHKPTWNQHVAAYVVDEWRGEPAETTDIAPYWVPKTNLPLSNMWPDNALTLPYILAGQQFTGCFLYAPDGTVAEYTLTPNPPAS